jgi:hypothetical protein
MAHQRASNTPVVNAASASADGVNPMVNLSWTPDGRVILNADAFYIARDHVQQLVAHRVATNQPRTAGLELEVKF